eukprot:COSAG01_NODE_4841_length_4692_cov_66.837361_4_plen_205_part_00
MRRATHVPPPPSSQAAAAAQAERQRAEAERQRAAAAAAQVCAHARWGGLPTRARCAPQYLFRDKNRRFLGKSQSNAHQDATAAAAACSLAHPCPLLIPIGASPRSATEAVALPRRERLRACAVVCVFIGGRTRGRGGARAAGGAGSILRRLGGQGGGAPTEGSAAAQGVHPCLPAVYAHGLPPRPPCLTHCATGAGGDNGIAKM